MEPLTFTLDRGRTLLLIPNSLVPAKALTGTIREVLASVTDERGHDRGLAERTYWGNVVLTWPNGSRARLSIGETERLNALFDPRRVSDLPAWDEMSELDRGAALMHAWKRKWEGAGYARENFPARYLEHPRLVGLSPELACRHAVTVAGHWNSAADRLGMEEIERLYYAALAEEDRRHGIVRAHASGAHHATHAATETVAANA